MQRILAKSYHRYMGCYRIVCPVCNVFGFQGTNVFNYTINDVPLVTIIAKYLA